VKVAYDVGTQLAHPTGVTRYALELADALEDLGIELCRYMVSLRARGIPSSVRRWRLPATALQVSWMAFDRPRIERLTGDVDLVHGTNFIVPPSRAPSVVTVHDLSFIPEHGYVRNWRLAMMTPRSLARADALLVPSQAIADEISAVYNVARERLFVTFEGVSDDFLNATPLDDVALARFGIKRPFIMALGTIQPRKNLHRLIEAWSLAADTLRDWSLAIVGPWGWGNELPDAPRVVRSGWVGDADLPGLLAAADVFCYPSLYEGFGLPPLEAMAAGTATIAGDYGAATEILGDSALIVDRSDVAAIADGLIRVATDDEFRVKLANAGHMRASTYTWRRTAEATAAAYRAVLM